MPKLGEMGVRWALVAHPAYISLLARHGWRLHRILPNGVEVWENPDVVPPFPSSARPTHPLASLSRGVLPGLTLIGAIGASIVPFRRRNAHLPE